MHAKRLVAERSVIQQRVGNKCATAHIVYHMPTLRYRSRILTAVALVAFVGAGVAAKMAYFPAANPLLRILSPDGITLSRQQFANPNTGAGLSEMVRLLETAHRPVPRYLQMVCDEYSGRPTETARFSVGCYWEGERVLGKLHGVVASRTGTIGKDEVVELKFDPKIVNPAALTERAKHMTCFRGIPSTQAALAEDPEQQHTLANHPEFAHIPMTPLQRTKVNAAVWDHQDITQFLSPKQLKMLQRRS
jgi:hypothetical protein